MKKGTVVKITDIDFVKANYESIGTVIKSMWVILPPNLYNVAKIHVYEVQMKESGMSILFPIESLIIL